MFSNPAFQLATLPAGSLFKCDASCRGRCCLLLLLLKVLI